MSEFDIGSATVTNLRNSVPDFVVDAMQENNANDEGEETFQYYPDAKGKRDYYHAIAEINSAANSLATWTTGRGISIKEPTQKAMLDHVRGMGNQTFPQIMHNHQVMKTIVGDAFMEIVWSKKDPTILLNLLPKNAERVRTVFKNGMIVRYEIWNGKTWKKVKSENMLHSMNKQTGDETTGNSNIDPCKDIIDARNEALADNRKILHRDMALGIVYYETDNVGKISYANSQIEKGVKNGEMVGLPEGTAKIEAFPSKGTGDRLANIQYLENFFYQTFQVPRSIATSDGTSEVGGKMGHVIFEPIYTKEQIDLEGDLRMKLKMEITFNRPPILGGMQNQDESKNTGQTNLQPNDVEASITRE